MEESIKENLVVEKETKTNNEVKFEINDEGQEVWNGITVLDFIGKPDKYGNRSVRCRCYCANQTIFVSRYGSIKHGEVVSCGCSRRKKVIIGEKIGSFTILEVLPRTNREKIYVNCQCDCKHNKIYTIAYQNLLNKTIETCSCKGLKDLTGKKIYHLTLIKKLEKFRKRNDYYECKCDCGNPKLVIALTWDLQHGKVKSCGCHKLKVRTIYTPWEAEYNNWLYRVKKRVSESGDNNVRYGSSLTFQDFINIVQNNCFYCGEPPMQPTRRENLVRSGIDRIDSNIGYTVDNAVACCEQCNIAKSDYTLEEFKEWAIRLYNNMIKKDI